ncbi:rhodanese-like domain-containing protein [Arsenicicoccus dermatophilus]|uniref:rhodanese-like domain-containing protein n=1 Tax=Arsenicicoccus dermatophilus TaxID=1076331 RepID=UPI001F4D1D7F|nr:rhodanese-like domain-containing protein [Arsenicicoccus dermatophilus]MCH8614353.1 rhodanese-like domain-containing protein [Arsenicicoccus dermatophilus]
MGIPTERQDDVPQISRDQLADDAVILDVRNQDEWDLGHAPGAIHIPLPQLEARVGELPAGRPLPVTCRGGGRAGRATAWLVEQGVDAANLTDGMLGWKAAGRALVDEQGGQPDVQ